MSYSGTMTSADWLYMVQVKAQNIVNLITEGEAHYKKWYDFAYGKTMAQIATALGITEAEATDMNAAFQVLKELNDALTNAAVSTADRKTKLLKFV